MSHDDELRNRVGRLADAAEIPELTLDDIQRRGQRRVNHQRILAVAAAFFLVVGAVGAVKLFDRDGVDDLDVASGDVETGTGDGKDGTDQTAEADSESTESAPTTTIAVGQFDTDVAADSFAGDAYGYGYGGPSWILPWQGGFLSLEQVFEPSDLTLEDLVPNIRDRLPAELLEALDDADFSFDSSGPEFEERFYRALESEDLYRVADESLWGDPVVSAALQQVMQGGSFRPEASVSPDGENWTVVEGFTLPGNQEYFSYVKSDGERLLIAEQVWDEATGENQDITVSHTTDLLNWNTTLIPVEKPDVPTYVTANTGLGSVELIDGGWYATTSTWSWVDLWAALPAELIEEFEREGWGWEPSPDGVRVIDYSAWAEESEAVSPTTIPPPPPRGDPTVGPQEEYGPEVVRVIPWSELGMTWEDYTSYGGEYESTEAWIGTWAGAVSPAAVPVERGCCTIIRTEAGLIAQAWDVPDEPSYYEYEDSYIEPDWEEPAAPRLFFSPDGLTWTEIDGPSETGWYDGLAAVEGGVLLLGGNNNVYSEDGDEGSGQLVWRGEPDGSNWQQIEIPGIDPNTYFWFGQGQGAGVASVVDRAEYIDYENDYVEPPLLVGLEVSFEADGNTFDITVNDDGFARFVITDAEGTVLVDELSDWEMRWPEDLFEASYIAVEAGGTGEEFFQAFEERFEEIIDQAYEQAEEIRAASGWEEPVYPEYLPDYWLIASLDGINWLVEDLPDPTNEEGYYNATPGISGNIVAVVLGDDWKTYSIS